MFPCDAKIFVRKYCSASFSLQKHSAVNRTPGLSHRYSMCQWQNAICRLTTEAPMISCRRTHRFASYLSEKPTVAFSMLDCRKSSRAADVSVVVKRPSSSEDLMASLAKSTPRSSQAIRAAAQVVLMLSDAGCHSGGPAGHACDQEQHATCKSKHLKTACQHFQHCARGTARSHMCLADISAKRLNAYTSCIAFLVPHIRTCS